MNLLNFLFIMKLISDKTKNDSLFRKIILNCQEYEDLL